MQNDEDMGSLRGRVARGTVWIFGANMSMRILGFVNTIIVARLLVPEDFGLVAIGVTTMQLLQNFSDIGVSQAVIRFQDADDDDLDTLFTLSFLRGVIVSGLLMLTAGLAADFYGDPRVFWVMIGVAVYPLCMGLVNPRFFEFERNMDFSKEFISVVANKLTGVAVSILIAVIFRSYWAIILGLVAGGTTQLLLSYAMRPHWPRLTFASFRKVFQLTGWLTGISFMAALNNKLDALIVARTIGSTGAGNYYLGHQLAFLPTVELADPIARAIYPGLSSLQNSPDKMRQAYLQGVEVLAAIAMPAAFGFAFVADDLITLLLGAKWQGAVPVIEILTPVLGLQTLFVATQFYAVSRGLAHLVFFRELAFFLIRTPIFIWASIHYGLLGAIYAAAGCGVVHVVLNLALYARVSRQGFWQPIWIARRSLFAVAGMTYYFVCLRADLTILEALPQLAQLFADIIAGGVIYSTLHFGFWMAVGKPEGVERYALNLFKRARA